MALATPDWRLRRTVIFTCPTFAVISTHTSLAGRDWRDKETDCKIRISTHTSLAGRDQDGQLDAYREKFLLTRPSRDVTLPGLVLRGTKSFLLTRPSRDVTYALVLYRDRLPISTHTSLAGRDSVRQLHGYYQ